MRHGIHGERHPCGKYIIQSVSVLGDKLLPILAHRRGPRNPPPVRPPERSLRESVLKNIEFNVPQRFN